MLFDGLSLAVESVVCCSVESAVGACPSSGGGESAAEDGLGGANATEAEHVCF